MGQVMFQTALIESGYELADASALVNRVYRLMSKELGVDPDALLTEVEVPEEEEEEAEEEEEEEEEEAGEDGKKASLLAFVSIVPGRIVVTIEESSIIFCS